MPIYEFKCGDCGKKVSVFLRHAGSAATCPDCGGKRLERLISSFAYHGGGGVWSDEQGPPPMLGDVNYYKDPRNIGKWTEHRLKELGMDMRSEEHRQTFSQVNEMIDKAREGEMPDNIKDI